MKGYRKLAGWLSAVAVVGLLTVGVGAGGAEPWKIRVGWVVTPGHLAPLIVELGKRHPEVFKHLGKSYVMDAVHFRGTSLEIQAQAINELDVASFSSAALALAITNAHLDEKLVADVVGDGMNGYFSGTFVVRADSGIKKVEDLKGKRVAINTIGSAADEAMRTMLHRHGLKDSDFTTVETNFANMPAMFEEGKVDMIIVLPQFAHGILGSPKYRVLFTARDAVGPTQAVMWAMRGDVIKAHRPALVDFFEDHIRARRWFLDPKNHKEAIDIVADVTKLPKDKLEFAFTKADFYRSPDAMPDVASVQTEIDDSVKQKVLPKPIQIAPDHVDLSLIKEAKKRIDGE